MSEFKKGDRVHVEFDGVVKFVPDGRSWLTLTCNPKGSTVVSVYAKDCTKIPDPIKVGDMVVTGSGSGYVAEVLAVKHDKAWLRYDDGTDGLFELEFLTRVSDGG